MNFKKCKTNKKHAHKKIEGGKQKRERGPYRKPESPQLQQLQYSWEPQNTSTNIWIQRSCSLHQGKVIFCLGQEREKYITRHPEKSDHGETKKQPAYKRKAGITRKGSKKIEASNLSEKEFREIVIRWLKRIEDNMTI